MNRLIVSLASILLLFFLAEQASAAITVITQPDAEYQEATTKIDVPDVPDATGLSLVTDGTLTVAFTGGEAERNPPVYTGTVGLSWATWSSPPDSESATPAILVNEDLSLTMDLSRPVTTFGFELEPFQDGPFTFDVEFVFSNKPDEPITVGTVQLLVDGQFGARLFAATTEDLPFDRIIINGGDYFAIAQIRYDVVVEDIEVEIDIKPGSSKNSIKLSSHSVIPVAILSNSDPSHLFAAATVVPSTVCFGAADDPNQFGDCTQAHKAHLEDVDGDGDLDLVLYFNTLETGIRLGDAEACLTGKTFSGVFFTGCDVVQPK